MRITGSLMLSINKDFSLDEFEAGLSRIALGEPELRIPNKVKASAVGSLAALIQLIITWAVRGEEDSRLRIHAQRVDDVAFHNFANTPFGVVALNMAGKVALSGGEAVGRREALLQTRDYVLAMHGGALDKLRDIDKSAIPIVCVDNAQEYRRPIRLYVPGTVDVRSARDFEALIGSCLRTLRPGMPTVERSGTLGAIAALVQEAFKNTDDHARTDFREVRLRRSTRGILVGYRYLAVDQLQGMAGAHGPLRAHFGGWAPRGGARHAQFVEVSVFDSGPGLAQNWLAKTVGLDKGIIADSVPLEVEYQAVGACLRKGGTTKSDLTSGIGLFRIMDVAKRTGGFVRIRSGRLSLIKAFDGSGLGQPTEEDLAMEDMVRGGRPSVPQAWAEGTVITAMLPLNRELAR
ncbi:MULTISPECIES: hypothetical protein [Roseomonadaceae]|uniref:ATP-binding protein n=1 Tax=Falsiroseomonas oleicola TaxID=2801474 RepID=A0ABS6HBL4_9PROT|nr:hypothetical protein [Roseomonas oleicola]MBU8546125.1 hypothetical protein [Roseomonas oleicola]